MSNYVSITHNHPYYKADDMPGNNEITRKEKKDSALWEKKIHPNEDQNDQNDFRKKRKRTVSEADTEYDRNLNQNMQFNIEKSHNIWKEHHKDNQGSGGDSGDGQDSQLPNNKLKPDQTDVLSDNNNTQNTSTLLPGLTSYSIVMPVEALSICSALLHGDLNAAKFLIENGANVCEKDCNGNTPLHVAASMGYFEIAKLLIENGASVHEKNNNGETPLYFTADLKIAKLLIGNGANVCEKDCNGNTPLHVAASMGYFEVAKLLIENGANVSEKNNNGETPLHFAANLEIAKLLIGKGATVCEKDCNGNTPLHSAASMGYFEVAKLLIENGANVSEKNNNGETPLHFAANLELAKLLIGKGAKVDEKNKSGNTPLHLAANIEVTKLLIENGANVCEKDCYGNSPLHFAVTNGYFEKVKFLIANGANVSEKNDNGETPLHFAANLEIAKLLIENGARGSEINTGGNSPLHFAASKGYFEIVELFIENGANVSEKNNNGETPLHFAADKGHFEIAKLLIGKSAKVGEKNNSGNTPLHVAASIEIAKLLLENGAKVCEINTSADTPLHYAASRGYFEIVELLIENEAKVDDINNKGFTPLHFVADKGYFEIAKLLIGKGAEVGKKNKNGETPLHFAAAKGYFEIVELLVENEAKVDDINNIGNTPLHLAANKGYFEIAEFLIKNDADVVDAINSHGDTPLSLCMAANREKKLENLLIEKGADFHYAKELIRRKWLAGGLSLNGFTKMKNTQVRLDGGSYPTKLVSIFENFVSFYPGLESLKSQHRVQTLKDSNGILTKFATNEFLHFHISASHADHIDTHAIEVVYIGDYLLISNRGLGAIPAQPGHAQSILVKRLDRKKAVHHQTMSLTIIDKLLKQGTDLSFFYDELPQLSGAIEDDFICNIFKSHTQKDQKVGNCWWISPKSMIFAIMAMNKLLSISREGMIMTEKEIDQHAGNALTEAKQVYKEFSKFSKILLFMEYLTEKMLEKDCIGDLAIPPDFDLLRRIYEKLIKKYPEEAGMLQKSILPFENKFNIQLTNFNSKPLLHIDRLLSSSLSDIKNILANELKTLNNHLDSDSDSEMELEDDE